MSQINKLFVYGTLKAGEKNHWRISGSVLLDNQASIEANAWDNGKGFPTITPIQPKKKKIVVKGELYKVDRQTLSRLDDLPTRSNDLGYTRKVVIVTKENGKTVRAYSYVAARKKPSFTRINGDIAVWRQWSREVEAQQASQD